MTSRSQVITTFINAEPDVSKHSAAYKIFHYEWDIALPQMYVYTEEYMRQYGLVVTGDSGYDNSLPNQLIGGRYTIAQMAELMDEGATIQVHNPEDTKKIYDIISRHLEDWSSSLTRIGSFDLKTAPENDLMLLSQLADTLYGYAARYFTNERPRGSLARKFDQIRGRAKLGSGRKFVDPNAVTPEAQAEAKQMPGHSHFTETILNSGGGRNPWS